MIIDGQKYRISVLILTMRQEVNVTLRSVETLLTDIPEETIISVLMNGGPVTLFHEKMRNHPKIICHESQENLGVAGGRNCLLDSEECRRSDIVFILDNDVVTPRDYIPKLAEFVVKTPDIGVAGAVIANFRENMTIEQVDFANKIGVLGNRVFSFLSDDIRQHVCSDINSARLFHAGIALDYRTFYFGLLNRVIIETPLKHLAVKIGLRAVSTNKHDPEILKRLSKGVEDRIECSNVAGCSQVFLRSLVEEIGGYFNGFNPYGFEDCDFCIRAMQAGRRNCIHTGTWLYHGTDYRHRQRENSLAFAQNQTRAWTVLAHRVYVSPVRAGLMMLRLILFDFLLCLFKLDIQGCLRAPAQLKGFYQGRQCFFRHSKDRD